MQIKSTRNTRRRLTGPAVLGAAALIVASVAAVGLYPSRGQKASATEWPIPHGASLASWSENGAGGRHLLQIVDGVFPDAGTPVSGVVASDTQCQPDAQGFSHCRNVIVLDDGTTIMAVDTHMMSRYPCLDPGQRLTLRKVAPSWLEAESS